MTVNDLINSNLFTLINQGDDTEQYITKIFCCDLLSIAMGRAPSGGAWVTVMGNINTLAVASLSDTACIILAEGVTLDDTVAARAAQQGITVFATDMPVFDAALLIHQQLNG